MQIFSPLLQKKKTPSRRGRLARRGCSQAHDVSDAARISLATDVHVELDNSLAMFCASSQQMRRNRQTTMIKSRRRRTSTTRPVKYRAGTTSLRHSTARWGTSWECDRNTHIMRTHMRVFCVVACSPFQPPEDIMSSSHRWYSLCSTDRHFRLCCTANVASQTGGASRLLPRLQNAFYFCHSSML